MTIAERTTSSAPSSGGGGSSPRTKKTRVADDSVATASSEATTITKDTSTSTSPPPDTPIVMISYQDLMSFDPASDDQRLIARIGRAFGSSDNALGILGVSDLPDFTELRARLLPLARDVALLAKTYGDNDAENPLVNAESLYSVGWSHGKEQLITVSSSSGANGAKILARPDTHKGSFYANPLTDNLTQDLIGRTVEESPCCNITRVAEYHRNRAQQHPEFYAPSVWPDDDLGRSLRENIRAMGQLLKQVGCQVAAVCDAYCREQDAPVNLGLEATLQRSLNCKARLLHYFAPNTASAELTGVQEDSNKEVLWCAWHNDHGSLTGLVPGLFLDDKGQTAQPLPSSQAGLWIQDRSGQQHRVSSRPDCAYFQIGETSQIQSGGLLQATPHAVVVDTTHPDSSNLSRESFAVFLEPEFDAALKIPSSRTLEDCQAADAKLPASVLPLKSRWKPGQTFGDFHKATVTAFTSTTTSSTDGL